MEATNRESFEPRFVPETGSERECVISRRDLEILLRGAESERETGYRNLFAGVAVSCGFGLRALWKGSGDSTRTTC